MCLEFLRSLQRLISLETTNLGWNLEKYHWLPTASWLYLKVKAHSYCKETIQTSYPSSNNIILNKLTSSNTLRWDHSGMLGLYYHPGIPRGTESQLPTALISSLIHSLLDNFLSLLLSPNHISSGHLPNKQFAFKSFLISASGISKHK